MANTFLGYSRCSTAKKAKQWLVDHKIPFTERDMILDNPTAVELREWQGRSGLPLKRFYNTSGMKYRKLGLKDRIPSMTEEEQFQLLSTDGMLVKRPIFLHGDGRVLVGFREKDWEQLLV